MIRKISKERLVYAFLTVFLSAIISISVYHLWGTDLRVPIAGYRSDSVGVLSELNNYVRGGSVHQLVIYGEQYANLYSGSFGDSSVPMPLLKLIWMITGSIEEAVNIHAILNSILLAASMFWVCTCLKVRDFFSMMAGVLYGNLSYFILGSNTVLLIYSTCFYIPLFCYILIELMRTKSELHKLTTGNAVFIMSVMLYVGMNSAYYAFFAIILLAYATMFILFVRKDIDSILLAFLSYAAIGMGIASYTLPTILNNAGLGQTVLDMGYMLQVLVILISGLVLWGTVAFLKQVRGILTLKKIYTSIVILVGLAGVVYVILLKYTDYIGSYAGRSLVDVQLGSLKVGAMVLPAVNSVFGLGNSALGTLTDINNMQAGDTAMIGVLAGVGFVYSVIKIFQYRRENPKDEVLKICGLFNCVIVVVAAKGGISLLIGAFITSGIRGYSRMCVYIATFGLISFALLADKLVDKIRVVSKEVVRKGLYAIATIAMIFGIATSIPTNFIYNGTYGMVAYEQRKKEYDEWYRYVGTVESQMPEGGTILELPLYMDPEHMGELMTIGRAYELSIPAIVSKTTYWDSRGGGEIAAPLSNILERGNHIDDFLTLVCVSGYDGIYIDTMMYHDDSYVQLIERITHQLGEPFICNENRRYFYSLEDYDRMLRKQHTNEELELIKEQIVEQY